MQHDHFEINTFEVKKSNENSGMTIEFIVYSCRKTTSLNTQSNYPLVYTQASKETAPNIEVEIENVNALYL